MSDLNLAELAKAVRSGDRRSLARAITLVESTRADHRSAARKLLELLMPDTGNSIRVGISGAPGVGKSTFIEALGTHVLNEGLRIAVLTVDPSSTISGGSILGDKTRMETLARQERAFIRPSPSGNTLGGIARRTRETLLLCEAAGYDLIVVETVGVGQSETTVADMTDMFVLLLLPGSGDQLQGIKRGIMELADLVLVNKADGDGVAMARDAVVDYQNAIRLMRVRTPGWSVEVHACSALQQDGIAAAWDIIQNHQSLLDSTGLLASRRAEQACAWMWSEVRDNLIADLLTDARVGKNIEILEAAVASGKMPATLAAEKLLDTYLHRK